jgi:hypothetical protein
MRFARLKNSIGDQKIEVASDAGRGQAKALPDGDSGRWPVLKD